MELETADTVMSRRITQVPEIGATPPGFVLALELFKKAAKEVPAYKDFLRRHHVNPAKVNSPDEFLAVPVVTKENYLKKYPLQDMLWKNQEASSRIISTSSGSSGQPFFWPRGNKSIDDSVVILDKLLDNTFHTRSADTLCINAFAMGTWIAGTYMTSAMWRLADLGHKIVTITPGISKEEIVREIETLGPQFKQIIIMGYPPFIKDVVDYARQTKVKLSHFDIKCIFAGENFSEQWRDYILDRIGKKSKPGSTLNIYGTADAGIIGIETPLSVLLRRACLKNSQLYKTLFGVSSIVPTVVQYNPELRYVEEIDGKVIFTADNSLPLIRYEILDEGRALSAASVSTATDSAKLNIPGDLHYLRDLPFIALFGRSDVAAIFYALNIYPENIKYGLESKGLNELVTGKFVIQSKFDDATQEQSLHIDVEVRKGVKPDRKLERKIFKAVSASLTANNSEYNKLHQEIGKKAEPIICLITEGGPNFAAEIKHRWVTR